MAKLNVNVTLEDGISSVTDVTLKGVQRSVVLNHQTGEVHTVETDEQHAVGDIKMSNNGAAVFPPQTLDGNFLEIATPEGVARFAVTGQEFQANGEYTLAVYLSPAAFNETTVINSWSGSDVELGSTEMSNRLVIGTIEEDPYQWVSGGTYEPEPEVTYIYKEGDHSRSRVLTKNQDYKLLYFDNTQCGQATVLAKGLGDYNGLAAAKTFSIARSLDGVIAFADDTPVVTLSTVAEDNTYTQHVTITGGDPESPVTYTLSDNTCGATIDAAAVSFTKAGHVTVTATVEDTPNCAYRVKSVQYMLTVVQGEAELSFADLTPFKTYSETATDNSYTQPALNCGDGTLGYALPDNPCGASIKGATVTFSKAGSVTVTAKATDTPNFAYTGTASYVLTVNGLGGDLTVTVSPTSYTYDGTKKTPTVTVKYGTKTLTKDVDYTLSGDLSAINVGQYTITATGKGGYNGTGTATWNITKQTGALTVSVSPSAYTYDGSQKTPTVTVKYGTKTLTKDVDYTLSGTTSAINAGSYTITATGKGGYGGTGTGSWVINQANGYVTLAATSGTVDAGSTAKITVRTSHGGTLSARATSGATGRVGNITVSGNTITVPTNGRTAATVTITVTCATDMNYKTATATYTLTIKQSAPTTLAELKQWIKDGHAYSEFIGYYVSTSGAISSSYPSNCCGWICYMSKTTHYVDRDLNANILVVSLTSLGSLHFRSISGSHVRSAWCKEDWANGFKLTTEEYTDDTFDAAKRCRNYEVARPSGASVWFIPSLQQWVNLTKQSADYFDPDIRYWTSTQYWTLFSNAKWYTYYPYNQKKGSSTQGSNINLRVVFAY